MSLNINKTISNIGNKARLPTSQVLYVKMNCNFVKHIKKVMLGLLWPEGWALAYLKFWVSILG